MFYKRHKNTKYEQYIAFLGEKSISHAILLLYTGSNNVFRTLRIPFLLRCNF